MLRGSAAAAGFLAALGALGCSDATEEPARGGLTVQIVSSPVPPPNSQCPSKGHSTGLGNPPPTDTTAGGRLEDGNGASVSCSVTGGDPFSFTGRLSKGQISFNIRGTVAPGGTGTAALVYYDNEIGSSLESPVDTPCTVDVQGGALQVAKGRIWAAFECQLIYREPTDACKASGVFLFENCGD